MKEDKLTLKSGDKVKHIVDDKWETIITIEHKTHGLRAFPENSCCINGFYWYYEDIKEIKKL